MPAGLARTGAWVDFETRSLGTAVFKQRAQRQPANSQTAKQQNSKTGSEDMAIGVSINSRQGGEGRHSGARRFAPIDSRRWQQGKPQRGWCQAWWVGLGIHLLVVLVGGGVAAWLAMRWGGQALNGAQLWGKLVKAGLAPQLLLAFAAWLLHPVVRQALQTRELRLSDEALSLHWQWPWLNRWLGWSVRLADLNPAHLRLPPVAAADPLPMLQLVHRFSRWGAGLSLANWAPLHNKTVAMAPWPAPQHPPSRADVFFMRTSRKLNAAQLADVQARALQLPLGQALAQRGVQLQIKPGKHLGGQLDLMRVPELRLGLALLAGLAVAALGLMVATQDWHFFRAPIGLFVAAALAASAVLGWVLWPKGDLAALGDEALPRSTASRSTTARPPAARTRHGAADRLAATRLTDPLTNRPASDGRANSARARTQQAAWPWANPRREGRMAALFMAVLGGGLCAWLALCLLVLWMARGPVAAPLAPQAFTLDVSHMPMGPIVLKAAGAGVPSIHTDANARFWQSQTDGQRYDLPVRRIGPWWVYDARPLQPAMQRFYGR
jgi:hypothetical protein